MRLPTLTIRPPSRLRIDALVELHVLVQRRIERLAQRAELTLFELGGGDHLGAHLAAMAGEQRAEGPDHVGHGEEAAVLGGKLQEIRGQPLDLQLLEDGGDGARLLVGGEDRDS